MSSNGQAKLNNSETLRKKIENYSYSLQDRLGSGYSSEVFRGCDDRDGSAVAVKVVSLGKVRGKGLEELLNREIRLLKELKHENIIGCLDVLMTANNCYIVTEYCPQGDLAALLAKRGRLPSEQGMKLILGICNGLVYLHNQGVMHRDIKPQNILLQGSSTKIADFGFACRSQLPRKEAYTIGSPLYMSPQALNNRQYSFKNDVWALGVTMYEILEGRPPWHAHNQKELRQSIKGELRFKTIRSQPLQDVIRGCLRHDSALRLSSSEVYSQLQSVIGVRSSVSWQVREDKENNQRGNCEAVEDQQVKKAMRNNYNFLKWLINYSRFSAKLLPRLQDHLQCESELKKPFVELTARLLHLTISKLNRVEEVHHQLSLAHFSHFKRTTRFAKIQAVTAEYHQRYLLLLTRLPYKYHHPCSLAIDLPANYIQNLKLLPISSDCSQEHLIAIDFLITLTHIASESKNLPPHAMIHLVDFEKLVESSPPHYCINKVEELLQRRAKIITQPLISGGSS